jgi:hypothetical protein
VDPPADRCQKQAPHRPGLRRRPSWRGSRQEEIHFPLIAAKPGPFGIGLNATGTELDSASLESARLALRREEFVTFHDYEVKALVDPERKQDLISALDQLGQDRCLASQTDIDRMGAQ